MPRSALAALPACQLQRRATLFGVFLRRCVPVVAARGAAAQPPAPWPRPWPSPGWPTDGPAETERAPPRPPPRPPRGPSSPHRKGKSSLPACTFFSFFPFFNPAPPSLPFPRPAFSFPSADPPASPPCPPHPCGRQDPGLAIRCGPPDSLPLLPLHSRDAIFASGLPRPRTAPSLLPSLGLTVSNHPSRPPLFLPTPPSEWRGGRRGPRRVRCPFFRRAAALWRRGGVRDDGDLSLTWPLRAAQGSAPAAGRRGHALGGPAARAAYPRLDRLKPSPA